jgi:ABC-type uncharacterized transport system substrate-binding protein
MKRLLRIILVAASAACTGAPAVQAHPHVWVTYQATFVYENGAVLGVDHLWTFDEMYTTMAIEGLDKNNDGVYTRDELAELAKTNMDGLKDFGYFTVASLGADNLKFAAPQDGWLEHNNGILKLHFRLPLAAPVPASAPGLSFAIFDPTYFIAFEPEKTDALKVAGAPAGCSAAFADASKDTNAADAKKLGDAFAQTLGVQSFGLTQLPTVAVTCKKS